MTAEAGRLAGLKVLDIINEPTSAALAYAYKGFSHNQETSAADIERALASTPGSITMVYDLGGGTFDVTLIRVKGKELTVLATAGDVRLGGCDWDERVFNFMADQFVRAHEADPREDPISYQCLMLNAEETKRILSARKQARFVVNYVGKTFSGEITREQFDPMTEDLLYRTESRLGRVIKQANLTWDKVDRVLAVGGSTRMPQVSAMLQRLTGKAPDLTLSPDEAIAHGAAIHAAICALHGSTHAKASAPPATDMTPAAREAEPPASPKPPFKSYYRDDVADLLSTIRTTNVNAHTLGVVISRPDNTEGVVALIPHDTQLPVSVTKRFGTIVESQQSVNVRVVEGDSDNPGDCLHVGSCQVRPLPPGLPKGSPIDVTFTYDNSGRLHVKAMDVTSHKWAMVIIQRRRSGVGQERAAAEADQEVVRSPVV